MALTVTIAGVDKTSSILLKSVRIAMSLQSRWTCTFETKDPDSSASAYRPALDATISITDGATTLFAGEVASVRDEPLAALGDGTKTVVTGRAWQDVVDQIIVNKTYGTDPVAIANSSVANPTNITAPNHGLASGDKVLIQGHVGSTPAISGTYTATVTGANNFTIPVNVTVSGGGGTVQKVMTLKSIVTDLRTSYLSAFGVTLDSGITDGPDFLIQKFPNVTLRSVFDSLAVQSGRVYRITPGLELQFFAAGEKSAPISITSSSNAVGPVQWEKTRDRSINHVVVKFGGTTAAPRTDIFTGNGSATTFPLTYEPVMQNGFIVSQGYVAEGSANYPLGLYPSDPQLWLYDVADNELVRGSAMASKTVATFTYNVQFPQTASAEDSTSIAARGRRTAIYEAQEVFDMPVAQDLADGILRHLLAAPKHVRVTTRNSSLILPGDRITLTFSARTVSGNHLVQSVEGRPDDDGVMRYTIAAIEGDEYKETYTDVLRRKLGTGGLQSAGGVIQGGVVPVLNNTDPEYARVRLAATTPPMIEFEDLDDRVDDDREIMRISGASGSVVIESATRSPDSESAVNLLQVTTTTGTTFHGGAILFLSNNNTYLKVPSISLANNAIQVLGDNSPSGSSGFLFIEDITNALYGFFYLRGGSTAVVSISSSAGWSTTAGTGSSRNVYWDAGDSRYELENASGGTASFRLLMLGLLN